MSEKEIDRLTDHQIENNKFQVQLALQTLKLLFLLNGVSVIAFLGFLGHKAPDQLSCAWFTGILSFSIGVMLTISANFFAYLHQANISERVGNRVDYLKFKNFSGPNTVISDPYFKQLEEKITKPFPRTFFWLTVILGVFSVLCFFAGVVLILQGFN